MQYALTELFEQRQDGRLTRAAYAASGGVVGALSRRADVIYASLGPVGQKQCSCFAPRHFRRRVEDTRRRVLRSSWEQFLRERLLRRSYQMMSGGNVWSFPPPHF